MKVKLPPKDKVLRGAMFPQVLRIDLNDFEVASLLPALFFKVLAQGRKRARRPNQGDPRFYIEKLSRHRDLIGFSDEDGQRLISRLTYTALITTNKIGRAKRGERILNVVPYNLLAHKPGFPAESSRLRNVDTFLYHAMRESLAGADSTLNKNFRDTLGQGLVIGQEPFFGGTYDGVTKLDTLSRLSIAFLDTLEVSPSGQQLEERVPNAFPGMSRAVADDLLNYIFRYSRLMPAQAFTKSLETLICFELYIFTLKAAYATGELAADLYQIPAAMGEKFGPSAPEIYVDFTGDRTGDSAHMASGCLMRDVETYQRYNLANLKLRLLHNYTEDLKRDRILRMRIEALVGTTNFGATYLQGLLKAELDPEIGADLRASARDSERKIRIANSVVVDEEGPSLDSLEWIDDLVGTAQTSVDRVVTLLYEAQSKSLTQHVMSWIRDSGGVDRPYGFLAGTAKNRASWRYAPTNDLLGVLVQLAAIRSTDEGGVATSARDARPIRLRAFLQYLYERFGILVDRPPSIYKGAEYVAAARANLRALERRLRQMGIFSDLSDDFTLQELTPPYMESRKNAVEEY